MGDLITDDMLQEFSVIGSPGEVGKELRKKLAGRSTRMTFYATYESDPAIWPEVMAALR
jgi:hypothetical protein